MHPLPNVSSSKELRECVFCGSAVQVRMDASAALVDCPNCGHYAATNSFRDQYETTLPEPVRHLFREYMASSREESAKLLSGRIVCDLIGRFEAYPARWTLAAIADHFSAAKLLAEA